MKQALKALIHEMEYVLSCINADKVPFDGDDFHEALRLGKEALAQPEQEPFGYLLDGVFYEVMQFHFQGGAWEGQIPVYTTPPQRKALTDEMVLAGARALAKRHADSCGLDFDDVWKYYADEHKDDAKVVIEAAHGIKEKNT